MSGLSYYVDQNDIEHNIPTGLCYEDEGGNPPSYNTSRQLYYIDVNDIEFGVIGESRILYYLSENDSEYDILNNSGTLYYVDHELNEYDIIHLSLISEIVEAMQNVSDDFKADINPILNIIQTNGVALSAADRSLIVNDIISAIVASDSYPIIEL